CFSGTAAPNLDNAVATAFCGDFNQNLDAYVSDAEPAGAELRWSLSADVSDSNTFLGSSFVSSPGTYYGFFYDPVNDCASATLEVTLAQNTAPTAGTETAVSACSNSSDGNSLINLDDRLSLDADEGIWSLT